MRILSVLDVCLHFFVFISISLSTSPLSLSLTISYSICLSLTLLYVCLYRYFSFSICLPLLFSLFLSLSLSLSVWLLFSLLGSLSPSLFLYPSYQLSANFQHIKYERKDSVLLPLKCEGMKNHSQFPLVNFNNGLLVEWNMKKIFSNFNHLADLPFYFPDV